MRYALVNRKKAVAAGFSELAHKVTFNGMVLNENELRKVDADDLDAAVRLLGGERLVSLSEIKNELNDKNINLKTDK